MEEKAQIFRPNKWKTFILFLMCSVFVALGIFMVDEEPIIGRASIIFFGFGALIALIQFYPNSVYLKLTDEGFEVKSLFRTNFTKWTEIENLEQDSLRGNKMICFDYTEEHKKYNTEKKIGKFLLGKGGVIQSIYAIKTKDLLALMKQYKSKSETAQ